jgi:hypothetical protein
MTQQLQSARAKLAFWQQSQIEGWSIGLVSSTKGRGRRFRGFFDLCRTRFVPNARVKSNRRYGQLHYPPHHTKRVRELVETKGCKLLYLPIYSPDSSCPLSINPIDNLFAKLKAFIRKLRLDLIPFMTSSKLLKMLFCPLHLPTLPMLSNTVAINRLAHETGIGKSDSTDKKGNRRLAGRRILLERRTDSGEA